LVGALEQEAALVGRVRHPGHHAPWSPDRVPRLRVGDRVVEAVRPEQADAALALRSGRVHRIDVLPLAAILDRTHVDARLIRRGRDERRLRALASEERPLVTTGTIGKHADALLALRRVDDLHPAALLLAVHRGWIGDLRRSWFLRASLGTGHRRVQWRQGQEAVGEAQLIMAYDVVQRLQSRRPPSRRSHWTYIGGLGRASAAWGVPRPPVQRGSDARARRRD